MLPHSKVFGTDYNGIGGVWWHVLNSEKGVC